MSVKDAYVAKLEAQLKEWSAELNLLKSQTQSAIAEGRVQYHEKLRASQSGHEAATQKLAELKRAGDAQWEALKSGVESTWAQLKSSIESVKH